MLSFWSILPIFRGPFLECVAHGKHYPILKELGDHFSSFSPPSENASLRSWFDFFYSLLLKQYRCEYVYKNTITTKLYLTGRHSFENSLLTDEFSIGNSRADVVILNGTSTVYEVKSKYDSLERLECQITDYRKVFDRIYVVTTAEKSKLVLDKVSGLVGVLVLCDNGNLDTIRKAESNKVNTDPAVIFNCMRRAEFCSVIKERFGYVPDVPNSKLYRESKKLFCQLDPSESHDLMVEKVRMRGKRKPFVDLINDVPNSLSHACLSFSRSQALAVQIKNRLGEPLLT